MARCPDCLTEVSSDVSSCPKCGHSFDDATRRLDSHARQTTSTSFDSIDDARFVPGAILANRYRIVGLLGKGGMGEVYRADDLKLGQPVALKFLPEELLRDGAALARFHREVRVARQVSHKNVCRVYDIAEFEGRHFLSMEFIKGEELSSLLRRIGRLPQDKAIQIARQICAGVSAAHDNGVLHRDLKPANVMIDEHGNARITDFGLAGLAEEFREEEGIAGTPAYMAPEQFEHQPATVRSDIYSIGLVLYELFTGKKAFAASTLNDLISLRRSDNTPTTPTSIVQGLDPLIEKVIDRCLQKEPAQRPSSALQVAAALPGGDPIAAALAAGETPSPEMVAAAPTEGALKPAVAIALLAVFLIALGLSAWLTRYSNVYRLVSLEKSPELLRERAREVVRNLGYTSPPLDSADGMILRGDYLRYIAANDSSPQRWSKLRTEGPGPYRFWYRQSPRYFNTLENISIDLPPQVVTDMTSVYLDVKGRLHWFVGVPPQREPASTEQKPLDWSIAFREAGLDIAAFQPAASTFVPLHAYDARAAWDGPDPTRPGSNMHVEAAGFRGRLIYFETIYPWDQATRQEQEPESRRDRMLTVAVIAIYILAQIAGAIIARRNLRQGRGDLRGATRLAAVYFAVSMLVWLFNEHHNGLLEREIILFGMVMSYAFFSSFFLWMLYIALEPFVRKRWPRRIISWSRLLRGDYRDPMVGRDLLIGAVFGALMMLCSFVAATAPQWLGRAPALLLNPGNEIMGNHFFDRFAVQLTIGLYIGFFSMFLLLLFVIALRNEWLALGLLWVLLTVLTALTTNVTLLTFPFAALSALVMVFILQRFGLLALISAMFFFYTWVFYPITTELTAWYARDFTIILIVIVALAGYAFYVSLGEQKVLGERVFLE